eukprot:5557059-Pleurochrysis_carterae.AAC.2
MDCVWALRVEPGAQRPTRWVMALQLPAAGFRRLVKAARRLHPYDDAAGRGYPYVVGSRRPYASSQVHTGPSSWVHAGFRIRVTRLDSVGATSEW